MVQWTDKPAPAPKLQVAPEERRPEAAPRPIGRKARKGRLAGSLQVLTICGVFGLIVAGVFMFKGLQTTPAAPAIAAATAQQRDTTTGRIVVMDRTQCRELGFDNQSGKMVHKGAVACHDAPHDGTAGQSLYRHPTNRLEHIRRSFAQ